MRRSPTFWVSSITPAEVFPPPNASLIVCACWTAFSPELLRCASRSESATISPFGLRMSVPSCVEEIPICSNAFDAAEVARPGAPIFEIAIRSPVVACAADMPWEVMTSSAPPSPVSVRPNAFAVGTTWPRWVTRSAMCMFPAPTIAFSSAIAAFAPPAVEGKFFIVVTSALAVSSKLAPEMFAPIAAASSTFIACAAGIPTDATW